MSNVLQDVEQECSSNNATCDSVQLILTPRITDLGGFSVRRLLPTAKRKMIGPWIFFDEMGPADFQAGEGINVRPHPHIGLATVTYLFEGEILHRDSVGSVQPIRPGDINLMVAGKGIAHSERERPEVTNANHRVHGLQLWLALPEHDQEAEPSFHHYSSEDIPKADIDGVTVRVLIGSAWGLTSPVRQFSRTLYAEAELESGQSLDLPNASELAIYVVTGDLEIAGTPLSAHSMAILTPGSFASITARQDTRIVLIGGEPLGKRFIEWNFVSTRKERIEQAKEDWQSGRFCKVVGDEEEYIPLPG
ncbi:pirin family protein [Marinobacter sp. F3R08]|uniref:pirin family protein n=1 Tax=Marinobacter sp. F3R08 TaxID=2841559 RepID=UPI001C08ADAF|nr:pirin family protein [Marinobacter sp. F3R08]MBU2955888.1 pirin family protein [Marinobacter sp. F3R08]